MALYQESTFLEITNQKQELPVVAIFGSVLAQNVQTL
jgi:hypothetical protein